MELRKKPIIQRRPLADHGGQHRIPGTLLNSQQMEALTEKVEDLILQHGKRGMNRIRKALPPGYCRRAAELFIRHRGEVLIGTGFPVAGSYESDGPLGAIALYRVLDHLGSRPVFACGPPISRILARRYRTHEIPLTGWERSREVVQKALREMRPVLLVSVERAGVAADGRYYNMFREDITDMTAKYDLFFEYARCPRIAFGDGGNEIGMGNVGEALATLDIIPSVTTCDELVIATVSNWGVYGVIALMSKVLERDLFDLFDAEKILAYLLANGCVDGVTSRLEPSEDGFPINVGREIIRRLRELVFPVE